MRRGPDDENGGTLAALEYENRKLRADNEKLHAILKQMQITLNRLISCYIVEARR